MAGTAPGHSLLWPGPHRDRADTLITMAGAALRCSLLWPGPRRDADCYGRDRHTVWTLQSNLKGVGGWRLPHLQASVFHPVTKPYNIVSQACAQKVFHYAFCMYTLSARFANVLMMQGIYHKPGTRPIWTGHTSNFLVHGEHARTC